MKIPILSGLIDTIAKKSAQAFITVVIIFIICILGFTAVGFEFISGWWLWLFIPVFIVALIGVFYGVGPWWTIYNASRTAQQEISTVDMAYAYPQPVVQPQQAPYSYPQQAPYFYPQQA